MPYLKMINIGTSLCLTRLLRFPTHLRNLFAVIITICAPSNPFSFWDKHKESLSEDLLRERQTTNHDMDLNFNCDVSNDALILLENKCESINAKTLCQLGLPAPV